MKNNQHASFFIVVILQFKIKIFDIVINCYRLICTYIGYSLTAQYLVGIISDIWLSFVFVW